MTWNWQQPDWPEFTWDMRRMQLAEEQFLLGCGVIAGTSNHLETGEQEQLTIESICAEALTTSEIEGEFLDRASVQSSIRKQFGLSTDRRTVKPAEQGIAGMMVSLYRSFAAPLTEQTLFDWHKLLTSGRRDLKDIGCYRSGSEPMQVVSGSLSEPKVHFEAPPSSRVSSEMSEFLDWFNGTAPTSPYRLPALTRAGVAHLYFESIHPFEDGNGRIGRAIAEKAIAQSVGRPSLTGLSATILVHRKAYYSALEAANKELDLTAWLAWFGGMAIEAQQRTTVQLEFLIDKTRLLDRLRGQINERQQKALLRILREGPEGFRGGLSAGNYVTITGASPATATRDLAQLVEKGVLTRTGELRHTRYFIALPNRKVKPVRIDEQGNGSA